MNTDMKLEAQLLKFCENISVISGIDCTLLNAAAGVFCSGSFCEGCVSNNRICCAQGFHNERFQEASHCHGKYIYSCPCGYTFIVSPVCSPNKELEYGLIIGPFHLSDFSEGVTEQATDQIPVLKTAQAYALEEIADAICVSLLPKDFLPENDFNLQDEVLQTMAAMAHTQDAPRDYPINDERLLQQLIREGKRTQAQQLLNTLLIELYTGHVELTVLKMRIRDLITLMSRAVIDSGANAEAILLLCDRCIIEMDAMMDFDAVDTWLGQMLHQFFDMAFDFGDVKHQDVIRKLSAYIQEHLAEKLTLSKVAKQVFLSKSYLCRIFKTELGCTFTEYVNQLRIERSKEYLRITQFTISDIASMVGYDDQSYFTRIFKRIEGVPPGKYRANNMRV